MEKSKQTVDESLNKIKHMMTYDSSKTLFENEGTITMEQVKPGEMAWKTGVGAAGAAGLGAGAGALYGATTTSLGALGATSATGVGLALSPGASLAAAGAIGGAVLGGAAAIALVPLVLWLIDKDKVYPKVAKLFKYVESNKAKIDQVERGLSDEEIWNASDTLFSAMKRLGTREKDVYGVFNSLQTISDLAALITFYNQDNDIDLLKQLNRDFDQTREWMKIYRPVRNLVLRFAKDMEEKGKEEQPDQTPGKDDGGGTTPGTTGPGGYKFVKGTADDPFKYGALGSGIAQVQQSLGIVQDGKWGPITQAKMEALAPEYVNGFTNEDILKVIQRIRETQRPSYQGTPTAGRKLNMSSLAPETNNLKLSPLAPNNMTAADAKQQWKDLRKQERQAR